MTELFTARSVTALRPTIQQLSRTALLPLVPGDGFDLISAYAQPYSVAVIRRLLGVPVPDGPRLPGWSHAIVKMYELRSSDGEQRAARTPRRSSSAMCESSSAYVGRDPRPT